MTKTIRSTRLGDLRLLAPVGLALTLGVGAPAAAEDACGETAALLYEACRAEVRDDQLVALAICENAPDEEAEEECEDEASEARTEGLAVCRDQRVGRLELCADLGGGRYDPRFEPALFDDPLRPSRPNPYFPLRPGSRWAYEKPVGVDETVVVTVLAETKHIEGVDCIVVNDRVEADGVLVEDTDDWYGIRKDGTVDYCGEIAQDYELFEGDNPAVPELVEIGGSWKHGRNGDLAGTQMLGSPRAGRVYRQEISLTNAEDAAEVLSTTYRYGRNAALDVGVPRALADRFCSAGDCVVIAEFTPIEPGHVGRKYYARGVGMFLDVSGSGVPLQLVECNVDPRCSGL